MAPFGRPNIEKLNKKDDVDGLIKALRYKDSSVRKRAALALGGLHQARAIAPLIATLADRDSSVRVAAVTALGKLGDADAREALTGALEDKRSSVRAAAAQALGALGDERAAKALATSMGDNSPRVRAKAAAALEQLGTEEAERALAEGREREVDHLSEEYEELNAEGARYRGSRYEQEQLRVLKALARTGSPRAKEHLTNHFWHQGRPDWANDALKTIALRAVASGEEADVETLVHIVLDESARAGDGLRALCVHRDPTGIEALLHSALDGYDADVQEPRRSSSSEERSGRTARRAMERFSGTSLVAHLVRALAEPHRSKGLSWAQTVLLRLFEELGDEITVDDLRAIAALPDGMGISYSEYRNSLTDDWDIVESRKAVSFEPLRHRARAELERRRGARQVGRSPSA